MSVSGVLWFMAVAFAILVVGVVVSVVQHRAKTQRMHLFAHQNGWQFLRADNALARRYTGAPFGRGSSRRAIHVVTGPHRGTRFVAFEYQYTERSGDDSTTHRFTVVAIDLPAHRPRLEVTRETRTSRFLGRFGLRDLQLEDERFNHTFRVSTDHDRFAYDVLDPPMVEWLLARGSYPFRFGGDHLLTWRSGGIEPGAVLTMLCYVCDLRDRVPPFVWRAT